MANSGLRELWHDRVKAFRASGLSGAAWCAQEGVSRDQLYYWLKKFDSEQAVEGPPAAEPNGWLPVVVDATDASAGEQTLAVRIGQAVIEVRPGFDQKLFTDVAKVLVTLC